MTGSTADIVSGAEKRSCAKDEAVQMASSYNLVAEMASVVCSLIAVQVSFYMEAVLGRGWTRREG